MGMAQLVVTAVLVQGRSRSEVARTYGVSRRWVITLVQRFEAEGPEGLLPRSRRPARAARTARLWRSRTRSWRSARNSKAGHEAGAATIAFHLEGRHDTSPAVSTIWRILTQRGFVTPQPHK
jgi:transposase